MTRPTQEYLIETLSKHTIVAGFEKLRSEGYKVSRAQCQRVRKRLRLDGKAKISRQIWDEPKIEMARTLAAQGKKAEAIGEAVGMTMQQVYNMVRRVGIKLQGKQGPGIKPPPPRYELEAVFLQNTIANTANAFETTPRIVKRWLTEYGISRPKPEKKPRIRPSQAKRKFGVTYTATPITPPTETGPLADAARCLRQQGYANVYRRGLDEWQVGSRPMSEKDMLARVDEMKARRARIAGGAA